MTVQKQFSAFAGGQTNGSVSDNLGLVKCNTYVPEKLNGLGVTM